MGKTDHTPGPWWVEKRESKRARINAKGWLGLAKVVVRMEGSDGDCADGVANARLIEAAPDLLAALIDAMRSSRKDFKSGPDGDRQHREAYAEQFAALDKATGAP